MKCSAALSVVLLSVGFLVSCGCDAPVAKKPKPGVAPSPPPTVPAMTVEPGAPPLAPPTETVKAEVGVGQKGRSLDEHEGVVVTPAKALFAVRERVVFDIQIPQAMQFYKATNGEGPKSHEEFMEKIIQANQIQLPELPPNNKYKYNVETEELEVERPVKN